MSNKLPRPKKKLSVFTITLAVVASILVSLLVCFGLMLLIESLDGHNEALATGDSVIIGLILLFTLGPTLIAAAVISVLLKRHRKN